MATIVLRDGRILRDNGFEPGKFPVAAVRKYTPQDQIIDGLWKWLQEFSDSVEDPASVQVNLNLVADDIARLCGISENDWEYSADGQAALPVRQFPMQAIGNMQEAALDVVQKACEASGQPALWSLIDTLCLLMILGTYAQLKPGAFLLGVDQLEAEIQSTMTGLEKLIQEAKVTA